MLKIGLNHLKMMDLVCKKNEQIARFFYKKLFKESTNSSSWWMISSMY